jgi:hypothetical protein
MSYYYDYDETIADMVGKTMVSVEDEGDELVFAAATGEVYKLYHQQDCCERVYIESVVGELTDLVGVPLLVAEEVSGETPADFECGESCTWTFYKFATIKGYVDVRWLGESNGYYGESVDFTRVS